MILAIVLVAATIDRVKDDLRSGCCLLERQMRIRPVAKAGCDPQVVTDQGAKRQSTDVMNKRE